MSSSRKFSTKNQWVGKSIHDIDYKNLDLIKQYVMESGRIIPSRITNAPAKVQRRLAHAIKVARFLALLPFCDTHEGG